MPIVVGLSTLLWGWMIFDFVRRGEYEDIWSWVVLLSPIGGIVYFFTFYLPRVREESPVLRGRKHLKALQAMQRTGLTADQLREMGDLYRDQKQWASAVEYYQQALQRFPERQVTRLDLARCLIELGRPQEAIPALEQVVEKDTFYKEQAALLLGETLLDLGKPDKALTIVKPLYQPTSSAEVKYHYALCLKDTGHRDEAKTILDELVSGEALLGGTGRMWARRAKQLLRIL